MKAARIALVGDFDPGIVAHQGIEASMALARNQGGSSIEHTWVGTGELTPTARGGILSRFDGIWCVPGSPYRSTEGAIAAIQFARTARKAFLGTCGGFQHALMEYAQNFLRVDAAHQEQDLGAPNPLIAKLSCSLIGARETVSATRPDLFSEMLGGPESVEEFNCNYGLNPGLAGLFSGTGMTFVAHDKQGQERAFMLVGHPFFVGTLFQPERRALAGRLHPVVSAFFRATAGS